MCFGFAGFIPSPRPEHDGGIEVPYTVDRANGIDDAGNIWENKNAARLGGKKNKAQIEDAILGLGDTGGKKVKLQVRCDADGVQVTKISKTITDIENFSTMVEVGCIPASIPANFAPVP